MAGTGLNLRAAIKSVQILEILAPALSPTFQNIVLRVHTYTLFQKYGMAKFYFHFLQSRNAIFLFGSLLLN